MKITEDMKIHEQWYTDAKMQTLETLPPFINHLLNDYEHDYGTICHAITAGIIAAGIAMGNSPHAGITGFQSGCIMWSFIEHWGFKNGALKLISYDDMLYPQYKDTFDKVIPKEVWNDLQSKARKNLLDKSAHPDVIAHWQSIVDGKIPFGYRLSDSIE